MGLRFDTCRGEKLERAIAATMIELAGARPRRDAFASGFGPLFTDLDGVGTRTRCGNTGPNEARLFGTFLLPKGAR